VVQPSPVTMLNQTGASPYLLVCEHASNYIPESYGRLGLPAYELDRHIAWDIGAGSLARRLSRSLDAPLFLSGYSRLLIDCNRPPGVPSSIPLRSETTEIPGNRGIDAEERTRRETEFFRPFHERIAEELDNREMGGRRTIVIGVHSFTPVFLGVRRLWEAGVLYGNATVFGHALLARLRAEPQLTIGHNEPYRITEEEDYTVPVHGDRRGLDAALLEVRQDLLATEAGITEWAERLAAALSEIAA
jgi:predicted N-formylglutamate amidohydrolase